MKEDFGASNVMVKGHCKVFFRSSHWLGSATGEDVGVIPVLAIPGWYIKIQKWADVRIYNGKNPLFIAKGKQVLSDQRMKAITHQVESKCRDVKPGAYRKD